MLLSIGKYSTIFNFVSVEFGNKYATESQRQNVHYIAHHNLNARYLANSKLFILLFCKHNKQMQMQLFLDTKRVKWTSCGSLTKKCSRWPKNPQNDCVYAPAMSKCSRLQIGQQYFHKVRRGIRRCVEARSNPSHIRGPWHQNKWRVLSGRTALKQEMLPDIRASAM